MKKSLWGIAGLLATMCACTQQPAGYTVEGVLNDSSANGKMIYIMRYDDQKLVDSTLVKGNKFTFKGVADTASLCRIDISRKEFANFILENGKIIVDLENFNNPSGTALNNAMAKIAAEEDSLYAAIDKTVEELRSQYTDEKELQKKIEATINEWREKLSERSIELYKEHNNDAVGFFLLYTPFVQETGLDNQLAVVSTFGPWLKSRKMVQEMVAQIESKKKTAEGQPFIEIKGKDINGNNIALSEFFNKGNYVLMDMWASWCGPCKGEIPNLAMLHNKYKDKGLTVLGVFVWDKVENLKKATEEEKITWPQIFDSEENATKLYGVNGIPSIILFAPDGTIVKRNLRGENMIMEVEEALKNK